MIDPDPWVEAENCRRKLTDAKHKNIELKTQLATTEQKAAETEYQLQNEMSIIEMKLSAAEQRAEKERDWNLKVFRELSNLSASLTESEPSAYDGHAIDKITVIAAQTRKSEADNAALLKWLEEHGNHNPNCNFYHPHGQNCDCGYSNITKTNHPGSKLLKERERERCNYREKIGYLIGCLQGLRYRVDDETRKNIEEALKQHDEKSK